MFGTRYSRSEIYGIEKYWAFPDNNTLAYDCNSIYWPGSTVNWFVFGKVCLTNRVLDLDREIGFYIFTLSRNALWPVTMLVTVESITLKS